MKLDKEQFSNATSRQKVIGGVAVVIGLIVVWQLISIFSGESAPEIKPVASNGNGGSGGNNNAPAISVQQMQLQQQRPSAEQQSELVKLQQETQQKYILAINELQMLKLKKEIEETNKAIIAAKLDMVKSEKSIVDLLTVETPQVETSTNYSPNMMGGQGGFASGAGSPGVVAPAVPLPSGAAPATSANAPVSAPTSAPVTRSAQDQSPQFANYVVISVSQLMNKWGAVVGYQGKLYSIGVGDVLPADGATVSAIDKSGIMLEKSGAQKKISLVPII